ncbi:hypothetical protein [Mycolicibacterium sphagni]|uniref:hypothetical protein n=1 Tax=Mycolicibacterium sphagni TaxID=1786 RepID=UPI0021F31AB3|nr:hypothetical protein [Mycolicibacterium sphagni]MCV7174832.1 hypothetical protein [Mycolicibacterium sphagni]
MTATATIDELYKGLQEIEAWIDLAEREVADLDADECSYEYARACAWLGTLEDRRERRLQWINAKNGGEVMMMAGPDNADTGQPGEYGEPPELVDELEGEDTSNDM